MNFCFERDLLSSNHSNSWVFTFSKEDLLIYQQSRKITAERILALRHLARCDKEEMEKLLESALSPRQYYLIKEGGLAAAAWLLPAVDWELVALVTGIRSLEKMILDLAENDCFFECLTSGERQAFYVIREMFWDIFPNP